MSVCLLVVSQYFSRSLSHKFLLAKMASKSENKLGEPILTLAIHPDVLPGLASMTAGGVTGGTVALGVSSIGAGAAVSVGSGAYALGGGATAVALNGGTAVAIGSGASASATVAGSVAVSIAPVVLVGVGVGALIGLLAYLVYRYAQKEKGKRD